MNSKSIILSKGYKYIAIYALLGLIFVTLICETVGIIFLLISLFTAYIYKNPSRHIYLNADHILSPVDGEVTAIDHHDGKVDIYCKVGLCDTHLVKAPIDGEMKIKNYQKGLNLSSDTYKASLLNEQITFKFHKIKLKLISGLCNPSIDHIENKECEQGENIAIFIDGIAIITLKDNKNLKISLGDKIKAGQTVISQ